MKQRGSLHAKELSNMLEQWVKQKSKLRWSKGETKVETNVEEKTRGRWTEFETELKYMWCDADQTVKWRENKGGIKIYNQGETVVHLMRT